MFATWQHIFDDCVLFPSSAVHYNLVMERYTVDFFRIIVQQRKQFAMHKFQKTGSVQNVQMPVRVRSGRSAENIYFFFKWKRPNSLTVNSERYRMIINDFLWSELVYIWTTCDSNKIVRHTINQTITLLRSKFRVFFHETVISISCQYCDLTYWIIFFEVKGKMHANNL